MKNDASFWIACTLGNFQSFLMWLSFPDNHWSIMNYAKEAHERMMR